MAPTQSLYDLLKVQETCTDEELRRAYCQLISNFHPDRNPHQIAEATAKTQELNEAYQELKRRRSMRRGHSHNVNKDGVRSDQFGFESGGIDIQFGFKFRGIDLDAIFKRKTEFHESWQDFRQNPFDPIRALLFIHASFEAERHEYVKDLLINPILTDLASLLLSRVKAGRACETLVRWANFLGDVGPGRVNADGGKVAVQILEDAFATGQASPLIVEELRSWHYRLAQYTDTATGSMVSPKDRITHLNRILELGFTFGYIYKLLAEAHHDLRDDDEARTCLKKAFEVDPNVSGTVRISRALGLLPVGKSAQPRTAASLNRQKWTRPEQIPSQTQLHEWIQKRSWDNIIGFANPNDYSPRIISKSRDTLRLIATALGDCPDESAMQSLISLLHLQVGPYWYFDVNQAAAVSLSKIGNEQALAVLIEFSKRDFGRNNCQHSTNRACFLDCVSYLRARIGAELSLSADKGMPLLAQAESAFERREYGQSRFLLERILADMAPTYLSYIDATVLLARSCAKMNDAIAAIRVIKPILDDLPNTARTKILIDTIDWLWRCLQGYFPIYDHDFQLALNIELELALSANTPDEVLRPMRDLTRWFDMLGEANSARFLRQLIREEAPGTWYVDKDDRANHLCNVMLSEDMCRYLVAFDMRIKSVAVAKLKQIMRSQHSIEPTASAIRDATPGTKHRITGRVSNGPTTTTGLI